MTSNYPVFTKYSQVNVLWLPHPMAFDEDRLGVLRTLRATHAGLPTKEQEAS